MTATQMPIHAADRRRWALFAVVAFVLLAAGWWYYRGEVQQIEQRQYAFLEAVGTLKAGQIEQWRRERTADARRLARSPLVRSEILKLLDDPGHVLRQADLWERLKLDESEGRYACALLLAPDGKVLLSTEATPAALTPATRRALMAALDSKDAVFSDFFREPGGVIHLDTVMMARNAEGQALAAVVLRSHASEYLYLLIQSWPTPSRSGETLLVQREGEEVLFLSELRFRTNVALSLRQPLTSTNVPAVQAVLGMKGRFLGRDYRDVEVLSDLRPIAGSPWFIVAKMDTAEIFAEERYLTWAVLGFVGLLILLAAAGTGFAYRRRQARAFRDLYESERLRREDAVRFRTMLYSIGDAVITTDTGGLVREMNPVAEKLTGWSEAEARGQRVDEIFRVINEATRQPAACPVNTALQQGKVVELTNHTLLIARDGTEYPVADSAAPIRSSSGVIVGAVLVFSDQTVSHAARQALRVSEEKLRMIVEHSTQLFYSHSLDNELIYVSPQARQICDFEPAEAMPRWTEFLTDHPVNARGIEITRAAIETGQAQPAYELELKTKLGRIVWVEVHESPVVKDGQTLAIVGALTDITERKRAEEALRTSEAEFRALAEAMPQIVWATRPDGWNIYFNQRWMDYTGLTLEESHGHGWNKPFHPEDQQRAWEAWRHATATGGVYSLECRLRRADGAYRWWLIRGVPWCGADGKILKWFGTCTDIHDLKQAAESVRLLGSAIEQSGESILITDAQIDLPGPSIIFANPAFTRMTGYAAAEVVGQTPRILHGPRTDQAVLDRLRQKLQRGEPFAGEAINYRKDGSEFFLEWQIAPLRNEDGSITNFVSIQRDITERKQAEERLQASVLEQQALLKEVHHRVKNNLQVITSLLRLEAGRIDRPMTRSVLTDMQHRIRTMALLHESLYRSRNFAAVDMAVYLNQLAANLFRAHASPAKTDQLRLELTAAPPPDSVRLQLEVASIQVGIDQAIPCGLLVNELVTNALKHAFPDGRAGLIQIELQPVGDGPELRLRVSDDGVGLPENIEERRKSSLGLLLVSDLARQLGGSLAITSHTGAIFEVTFAPQTSSRDTQMRKHQL
jgi:PAS domain S-box-containing protein